MCRRTRFNAARPGEPHDCVMFRLARGAVGPGDLNQGRDEERRSRFRIDPEFSDPLQKIRIVELQLVPKRRGNVIERRLLAQLLE